MTLEAKIQEVIIAPNGPQGGRIGLQISDAETMQKFDEAVGELPVAARKNLSELKLVAGRLGIPIVD